MVQKHEMIAGFERLTYSSEMLREEWNEIIERFKLIINGGWTDESVLGFINYILQTDYADRFFPGSSLGTLLISKPEKGRLNYQRTLAISFDRQASIFRMTYSDWDTIASEDDGSKAVLWTAECSGNELQFKFDEFMKWNKNWS